MEKIYAIAWTILVQDVIFPVPNVGRTNVETNADKTENGCLRVWNLTASLVLSNTTPMPKIYRSHLREINDKNVEIEDVRKKFLLDVNNYFENTLGKYQKFVYFQRFDEISPQYHFSGQIKSLFIFSV